MADFDSYIIFTSPRSGSTLFCKLLAQTREAGVPESYFHTPSIASWAAGVGFDPASKPPDLQRTIDAIIDAGRRAGVRARSESHRSAQRFKTEQG